MDVLKEAFDALNQRIRSPMVGSVLVAFCLANWMPLWVLFFADMPTLEKLTYFEAQTSTVSLYVAPVVLGLGFAIAAPWIKLVGAWVAQGPMGRLRRLQASQSTDAQVFALKEAARLEEAEALLESEKAERKAAREKELIGAAKRLEEAKEISPEAVQTLQKKRDEFEAGEALAYLRNNEVAKDLLEAATKQPDGWFAFEGNELWGSAGYSSPLRAFGSHRETVLAQEAAKKLESLGVFDSKTERIEVGPQKVSENFVTGKSLVGADNSAKTGLVVTAFGYGLQEKLRDLPF